MKDAIGWSVFPELLKDLYRNDTDQGARPDIPVTNHGQGPLPAEHVQHGGRAGGEGDKGPDIVHELPGIPGAPAGFHDDLAVP